MRLYAATLCLVALSFGACREDGEAQRVPSVSMEPVQGTTVSELLAEYRATVEEAGRLAEEDGANPRYLMLMSKRIPAITKRIDALVRPQCPQHAQLAQELRGAASKAGRGVQNRLKGKGRIAGELRAAIHEAQREVVGRWKGKTIVVIGTLSAFGEREKRLTPADRELLAGKARYIVDIAPAGSIGTGAPVRLALTDGEHAESLKRGGVFKVTGTVLDRWPATSGVIQEPVLLAVSNSDTVP